jgi:outer membrane lipoprotein-sorting protein
MLHKALSSLILGTTLLVAGAPVLSTFVGAQPAETIQPIDENSPRQQAIRFLAEMERANENVTTLQAEFTQVRQNQMYLEEAHSNGEFYYSKPNRFRCNYFKPSDAEFYILDNTAYFYTPDLKQVEKLNLGDNEQAPIHQMLVGFGLSLKSILEVFDPAVIPVEGQEPNLLTIEFVSKDQERTLNFRSIQVTFDTEKKEPRQLFIVEDEDEVRVTLVKIMKNNPIDAKVFELNFPSDVDIISYE